ncbi:hypothetical protein [Paracraurococcus lichenis]|uniref:Uncharacterized protein n=1 Tax=Paracraurococcus lichenis TaxID=3064888 RepID=A0ABT9EEF2_9PROT|nr:hypothetical protein [Paracraurococcus sp. LOR1-02]MDO9714395.1 hypothetical protein [Paracraurococcus sp. LOR1-02]
MISLVMTIADHRHRSHRQKLEWESAPKQAALLGIGAPPAEASSAQMRLHVTLDPETHILCMGGGATAPGRVPDRYGAATGFSQQQVALDVQA